jgi:hypothetical protein
MFSWLKNFWEEHRTRILWGGLCVTVSAIVIPSALILLDNRIEEKTIEFADQRFDQKIENAARKVLGEQLKENWAQDKFIKNVKNNIVGLSYSSYFILSAKSNILESVVPVYVGSKNSETRLYMDIQSNATTKGDQAEIEIFVDSVRVDQKFDIESNDTKQFTIVLSDYVSKAKDFPVYRFDGNVHTVTFRIKPSKRPNKTSVTIKALINVYGLTNREGSR